MSEYDTGGYTGVSSSPALVWLDRDECIISAADVMAGRWVCSRGGHPTPTSDCTTGRGGMSRRTEDTP